MYYFPKKNKKNHIVTPSELIAFILVVAIWILFALNTDNVDYYNYARAYDHILDSSTSDYFEVGFFLIMRLSKLLGLSYQWFLIAVATLSLLLMSKSISYFSNNQAFVWLVYMIYPFFFDVVQYRSCFSFAICFYFLRYIVCDDKDVNIKKFIIGILLASIFHSSSIIYVCFLLIRIKNLKRMITLTVFVNVVLIVIFSSISKASSVLSVLHLEKYIRYLDSTATNMLYQYALVYLFFLIISLYRFKDDYSNIAFKLMVSISLFLPMILLGGTAGRVFRNTITLAVCINSNRVNNLNRKKQVILCALIIVVAFYVSYSQLGNGLYTDTVLIPVLEHNILW